MQTMPSRPSDKLIRHGRLATAYGHHMTLPNSSPDVVRHARHDSDKVFYDSIDPKSSDIFRLALQIRRETADVVSDKPVINDAGEMTRSDKAKQNVWAEHYEWLINVGFDWEAEYVYNQPSREGEESNLYDEVKAADPSGIVGEMIKAAGDSGVTCDLETAIIGDGRVQRDCDRSFIGCLWKGKDDALDRCNYQGLKLTKLAMKILDISICGCFTYFTIYAAHNK